MSGKQRFKREDMVVTYTPIVYNPDTDYTKVTNVLLVDTDVQDYKKFVEGCNSSTFPIVFSRSSNRGDIADLLASKLPNISRIAIVANDSNIGSNNKSLFNYKPYFLNSDLTEGATTYSENLQFLIDLIKTHSIKNIDYLACYSLNYDSWKGYYNVLTKETGVTVGASSDATGNIKYGGDWVMESTGVDVEAIYFSDGIGGYQGTLATTIIGTNGSLNNNNIFTPSDGSPGFSVTWPITLSGTMTLTFSENLDFFGGININNYFRITNDISNNVIIDGDNHIVSIIDISGYQGLVQSRSTSTRIRNIGVISTTGSLNTGAGWIGWGDINDTFSFYGDIDNCYSTGTIGGDYSGGIVGASFASLLPEGSSCTISNCYSTGFIIGEYSGGIVGYAAGHNSSGNCIISNCYSTGAIGGTNSGGIVGITAGSNGGTCTISNCYSTGAIGGTNSGGIAGSFAGSNLGTCTINNCYSIGSINGNSSGGIAGNGAGDGGGAGIIGNCTITNCYSIGAINGTSSGGIVGNSAASNSGTCTISNCYSTGTISGGNSGGIAGTGAGFSGGTCTITNCYSIGTISGIHSGGIAGGYAGIAGGVCNISNCYSIGTISGINSGGIAGSNAGSADGVCNISNCYSIGIFDVANNIGGIFGSSASNACTITNCYVAGSNATSSIVFQPADSSAAILNSSYSDGWSDTSASIGLLNPGTGSKWKLVHPNSPWKLAIFLQGAVPNYNSGTLVYTNTYPISAYPNALTVKLINNSITYGNATVTLTQKSVTLTGVNSIDNGLSTYLALYNVDSLVDYADTFIIGSTTTTTSTTTSTTTTSTTTTSTTTTSTTTIAPTTTSTTTIAPTTTSTTTLPPSDYTTVQFAIEAPYNIVIPDEASKQQYITDLIDRIVFYTEAPVDTITILSVTPGSIVNELTLPTQYVALLQYVVQSGNFQIIINGVTYQAIPSSFKIIDNICFQKGTMILTPSGYKAVEKVNSGDVVKTAQGRSVKVQKVTSFIGSREKCPLYVLHKDSLGTNMPLSDLYMSEGHAYRHSGHWCHMKCSSVAMKVDVDEIEYYNIVLDNYLEHTLVANGVEVESLFDMKGLEMTWNCGTNNCKPVIALK